MKHTKVYRVAKTRKSKSGAMRIPELKLAFDGLNNQIAGLLKEGLSEKEQIRKVQSIWKSIFHRPVSAQAAEAYLKLKSSSKGRKGKTRKAAQKGGAAALAGAPLDYTTRPGVDGVYGQFPAYQTAGLKFYDSINQEGMYQECGTKNFTAAVPASIGSGQLGGGPTLTDSLGAITSVKSASPPGVINDATTYWQGRPLGASSAPHQQALKA
jgi:hypothetical protein